MLSFAPSPPARGARDIEAGARSVQDLVFVSKDGVLDLSSEVDAVLLIGSPGDTPALLDNIAALRRERSECAILVSGENFDRRQMMSFFRAGAHDFVGVPFSSDELVARVQRAIGHIAVEAMPDVRTVLRTRLPDFVGQSPAFTLQVAKLPMIAGCDAGVLILGETGTGKEVCARAIHYLSARASRPWVAVNCGAIPIELIESELFGHVRGAYTSAQVSREGLVSEAESGSLFLDDVDCMPMAAQSKLLRFLEEREYRAVGSSKLRRADVRVIAASNRNLAELARRGEFRQDLYFRLNVLVLALPPLRSRQEDIPALAAHFLAKFAREIGRPVPTLSPLAIKKLLAHNWPGNVRELQHMLRRALVLAQGSTLSPADFDIEPRAGDAASEESFRTAKARVVDEFERAYIERVLAACRGNVTHAAIEAKKNRRAFFALIRKHEIEPHRFRPSK